MTRPAPRSPLARFVAPAALVLGGMLIGTLAPDVMRPASASAQAEPPFNAAEQRKRMIEQLTQMNDKLSRIDGKLDKTMNVKVVEMPASKDSGK